MSPRSGRPKSDCPKDRLLQVRMDDESMRKLDECTEAKDTTRAEIVRMGIELVRATLSENEKKA